MENKEQRAAKLMIVIGYNGTGKTTLVKRIIANTLKQPSGRVLVVTPDDIEFPSLPYVHDKFKERIRIYKGARKIIYFDGLLPIIADNYRNGLLVFDDCRAYLDATLDMELHNLLIRRRQKSIDIIAAAHGFTEIPPKFFTFASDIILFKTIDNIKRRKDVIRDFDKMVKAQEYVNKEAEKNPHFHIVIPQ